MVKVFLEESAELCIERLDTLLKAEKSYKIICPSKAFIEKLLAFYPHLSDKNLRTISQLISELGHVPISTEIANVFSKKNPFLDSSIRWMEYARTATESEKNVVKDWLKAAGFEALGDACKSFHNFCKTCIFFGPFGSELLNELWRFLNPVFENFFAIKRTSNSKSNLPLSYVKGCEVRNIQQEREYVRKTSQGNTDFIACHPERWAELFRLKNSSQRLQWIDYQEKESLGYFLPYLYTSLEDKTIRDAEIRKLKNAQEGCYREDLFSLKSWLSQQVKTEALPFTYLNWPPEGPLSSFAGLLNDCGIAWNLPKALESCPVKFTRRQFFAYLRENKKRYNFTHLIPWEDALYLPIKSGCFLHGISEEPEFDVRRLSWFKEIENRGGTLTVIVPKLDERGMPYTPLIPIASKVEKAAQKLEQFRFSNGFILPKNRLKLSCKNWERYRLSPVRTWFDAILKVRKFDLIQSSTKAKICGEWVHENLGFETQPKNLETWQASIAEKAEKRWQTLELLFPEKVPDQLQQWHTRTYRLSLQMAQACNDLLDGSWKLQSEYVLPKNSENSGRIDLLATRSKEAVIVDFKTATDYTFTTGKLNKGHGLQLLLYGRALEPYCKSIQLRVINGNCDNLILDLHTISPEVNPIEAWLAEVKRTGIFTNLPEEKADTLPFCW